MDYSAFYYLTYPHQAAKDLRFLLESAPEKVLYGRMRRHSRTAVGWEETAWRPRNLAARPRLAMTGMMEDGEITTERGKQLVHMVLRETRASFTACKCMKRLLIRPGGIGDVIVSLPALEFLKADYTEVWVPSAVVPLIQFADKVCRLRPAGSTCSRTDLLSVFNSLTRCIPGTTRTRKSCWKSIRTAIFHRFAADSGRSCERFMPQTGGCAAWD